MTHELHLMDYRCNLNCRYCFQSNVRAAEPREHDYNLEEIFAALENSDRHFVISGGEPLLAPKSTLKELWRWGYEKFGKNGLQTNGTLIDDDHIEMFKKYRVDVSFSFDGPGELNQLRQAKGEAATEEFTRKTEENLERLLENPAVSTGVLITLNQANAGNDTRIKKLKEFILDLAGKGQTGGSILTLINNQARGAADYFLDDKERAEKFVELAKFMEQHSSLSWNPFKEIKSLLRGDRRTGLCSFNNCDPLHTKALSAVKSDGSTFACTCFTPEGFAWKKAANKFFERQLNLYQTPPNLGGCKGCRFFVLCGGGCPAGSLENDWRNKTRNCLTYKSLFKYYEKTLVRKNLTPISKRKDLGALEDRIIRAWRNGKRLPPKKALDKADQRSQNIP